MRNVTAPCVRHCYFWKGINNAGEGWMQRSTGKLTGQQRADAAGRTGRQAGRKTHRLHITTTMGLRVWPYHTLPLSARNHFKLFSSQCVEPILAQLSVCRWNPPASGFLTSISWLCTIPCLIPTLPLKSDFPAHLASHPWRGAPRSQFDLASYTVPVLYVWMLHCSCVEWSLENDFQMWYFPAGLVLPSWAASLPFGIP